MGIKSCSEIKEAYKDWDFLKNLPSKIADFTLTKPLTEAGLELIFARYTKGNNYSVELIYTEETGDFVVVKNAGLFRFRDDRYYFRNGEQFAKEVGLHLEMILNELGGQERRLPASVFGLDFANWQDWTGLPKQVGDFQLVITPARPLRYINGSWVLFAYEDEEHGHQLAIFYNEFRNEVFGELKRRGVFEAINDFSLSFDEKGYQHKAECFLPDVTTLIVKNLEVALKKLIS